VTVEADALYRAREQPGNLDGLLRLLRGAARTWPDSHDVGWRLGRAACWASEGATENANRRALAKEGWDAAERAAKARPDRAEGHYFTAYCVGQYALTVGILTALRQGLDGRFREPLLRAAKLDDRVGDDGVYLSLGRYKSELPWPLRSLAESERYLRMALKASPHHPRAKLYLAETLVRRGHPGDRAEADRLLAEVVEAPVGRFEPAEDLRTREMAVAFLRSLGR
jgi:hypothetical protein